MKLILLGPPGAGKGTQAKSICDEFKIPHISSGDIFRKYLQENKPLGIEAAKYINKGELVPDDITIKIMEDRLSLDDSKEGFLLDGFPRTIKQAEKLDAFLNKLDETLNRALIIDVPKSFILERVTGRRICTNCGASYHIVHNPPKVEGICDVCGKKVVQREDDTLGTVNNRLEVYYRQTSPVIDYYREKGVLSLVDGTQGIAEVLEGIFKILRSIV